MTFTEIQHVKYFSLFSDCIFTNLFFYTDALRGVSFVVLAYAFWYVLKLQLQNCVTFYVQFRQEASNTKNFLQFLFWFQIYSQEAHMLGDDKSNYYGTSLSLICGERCKSSSAVNLHDKDLKQRVLNKCYEVNLTVLRLVKKKHF